MTNYIDKDKLIRDLIDNRNFYPAIVKRAIDKAPTEDVVPKSEIEKLQAQIENLEIIEKDLRFRNKELQKANEGLAKNINELWNELDKVIEVRQDVAREIFEDFTKHKVCTNEEDYRVLAELKKKYQ